MVVLRRLMTLDQARTELTKGMILNLTIGQHGPETVDRIGTILQAEARAVRRLLAGEGPGGPAGQFRLGDDSG